MSNKNNGFVIANLLVVASLVSLLSLALLRASGAFDTGTGSALGVRSNAIRHMDGLDPDGKGHHEIDCEREDRDGNGYVSCTARFHDGPFYFFECTREFGGCRPLFEQRTSD